MSLPEHAADSGKVRTRWACCLGMLAVGVNGTAIMAALPTMRTDLALDTAGVTWAVNGYLLTSAACIILGGRASDWVGARRVAQAGLLLFAAASAAIALAPGAGVLLAGRVGQGLGAALAVPGTLACIGQAAAPARRAAALSAWAAALMLGFSLGPLVGGAATHALGWRAVFWCVGFAVLSAAAGLTGAPTAGDAGARGRSPVTFDVAGFALLAVLMVSAVLALDGLPEARRAPLRLVLPLLSAVAAAALLVWTERRRADPFVDLAGLSRAPLFLRAATIGAIAMFGILSTLLYFNLDAQSPSGLGLTPVGAGLILLPLSVGLFAVARLAPRAVERLGFRGSTTGALVIVALACGVIAAAAHERVVWMLGLGLLLFGAGLALPYATAPRLALASLPPEAAGQSSGLINACTFLGGSVGVSCGAVVYPLAGLAGVMGLVAAAALIGAALARGLPRGADDASARQGTREKLP
ncbi:MFS transporter [Methylobacterium oxalidis]|uniref:Drug resistance transporter, EmrB/QacA family protein n=1 Tax=Methylobacterium oxalidis TaxID=944322 RepID=A0A512JBG0_9HYPH|nr:MFS transporter [Methylobacterium oxalidis]GEP07303.1 putative drug resistance transporter, EmrB/QacA family protein [Methylobacterium oxalidis]GJE31594.1 Antiseptic resistance protein [Methylobacterium oxalidis]GLS64113.1 putative drug resistance transporter, EmrB/QacA family protein [Methylobacterium oxalidis]